VYTRQGLAGPVGADQGDPLVKADIPSQVLEQGLVAKGHVYVGKLDHGLKFTIKYPAIAKGLTF
jgi:hypothetical protein